MNNNQKIIDCHYCENAMCSDATGWCDCYIDDGYFDHTVEDSKLEAEQCPFFSYFEKFPKC